MAIHKTFRYRRTIGVDGLETKQRRSSPSINERAHASSVASGRGKIADEALRKFSWESDGDPTE